MTCETCGVVDGQVTVALDRQKACARQDDKTIVADLPSNGSDARINPLSTPRSKPPAGRANDASKSSMAPRCQSGLPKKWGLVAQSRAVKLQFCARPRERGDIDPEVDNKLRPVMCVIEACFDQIGPVHMNIKTHSNGGGRIVQNGMKHGRHCGPNCQVSMSRRSNKLIGICVVELCLQRLLCTDNPNTVFSECPSSSCSCSLRVSASCSFATLQRGPTPRGPKWPLPSQWWRIGTAAAYTLLATVQRRQMVSRQFLRHH